MTTRGISKRPPQHDEREVFRRMQGQAPMKYCVWEITLACDLGCRHCGSRAGKARERELSTAQCLDVVAQLAEIGVQEVTLIGGEAYLREDWDLIAKAITDAGMSCTMTSGGRGLDKEQVQRAVDAGMRAISISIDGLRATHNALRGPSDSFDRALAAAERIADSPIRLSINTQINRLSMPELVGLAELLIAIEAKAWQLQLTVPMGRAADRPELLLQPYDLLELFPLLRWIKEQKCTPHGIMLFPGNNIGYFSEFEEALRYGGKHGVHWNGCAAGKHCMGVEADGAIKGCPSLPTERYTGGNSKVDRVAEVLAHAPEVQFIQARTRDDLWGFCRSCYYADVCRAGCTWTSQVLMGRPGNNPYCIHRALTHEAQGKREVLRRVEAAAGDPFDHGRFEITLQDMPPVSLEASILGQPLERVMALDAASDGLWSRQERRRRLKVL